MNWVDIALLLVIFLALISGVSSGFIAGSIHLLNWLGSLFLALIFYPYTATALTKIFPGLGVWKLPLAFILTVIVASLIIGFFTRRLQNAIPYSVKESRSNELFGIIPGLINGLILAMILSTLLLALPLLDGINAAARNSRIASALSDKMEQANEKLSPIFSKAVNQTINNLTVHPESTETVKLPFKVEHPKVRTDLEEKMLQLLNEERTKRNLSALRPDSALTNLAIAHSKDMFARGYFSHISPEGESPFDRMKEANIHYLTAGENLALAQSLSIAHTGLMNSPGHRANILNPSFGHIGIGILDGGIYGLMISQEFKN